MMKALQAAISIGLMSTLLWSNSAEASYCEGQVFTPRDAAQKLTMLNTYLVRKDETQIKRLAGELEANLPCMKTPAPPQVFAQAYRYIGLGHYYRGDIDTASRWFRSALELSPNHKWGVNEVDMSSDLFSIYEDQRALAVMDPVPVEGMALRSPEGTIFYLDGRPLREAKATVDRPHILFIASETDRHIISRFMIDGNQFPQQFMVAEQVAKKSKKGPVSDEDMFAVQTVKRVRPKSKTPLLVSSLATFAVAGGVYGYTFTTNAQFYEARDLATKDSLRATNNALVITSAALGVAGIGVGYAGVIVDAKAPIIPWQL
jgi:hypothetical protein